MIGEAVQRLASDLCELVSTCVQYALLDSGENRSLARMLPISIVAALPAGNVARHEEAQRVAG
jgi:hypothetical protein